MTDKSRIIVIIVIAMAIILAVTAFAYNKYKKNIAQQASGGPHIVEPRTKAEQNLYVFDNVLDSAGLLGKSVAESGIDEKYFQKEIFFELKFGGKLFSKEAGNCSIVYNQRDDEGEYFADTVYIYSYEVGFDEAAQELTKLYGEPTGTGEEPYVETNGGALSWADFENDGLKIKLTQGSENDYISITVKLK